MKKYFIFLITVWLVLEVQVLSAQNYTSTGNGSWTSASNWNNTSGWGNDFPSVNGGHSSGTATVAHDLTISGDYELASATVKINPGKTLTVTGDFKKTGGGKIDISGTLVIDGDVDLDGPLNILPGGQVIVHGKLTFHSSNYLTIGTSAASPPYADLIVYQDVVSLNSADISVNKNGRVAIFGNVTATGGGTLFTIKDGGQVYVDGDIDFSGGGSHIINNNGEDPFGFYVKGTITNSGGGSGTTTNIGDEQTLEDTNSDFFTWVAGQPGSPLTILPITLLYFNVEEINDSGIMLEWATSMEINFDYFLLERSGDGLNFETISKIEGHGETKEVTKYSAVDFSPLTGKNYYRLKSVDLDSSEKNSKVVMANWNGDSDKFAVYPNPVEGNIFTIQSNEDSDHPVKMEFMNNTGETVFQMELNSSSTDIELPENTKPGTYILRLNATSSQKIIRLLVK